MLERVRSYLSGADLDYRAIDPWNDYPGIDAQLLAAQGVTSSPWAPVSIRQALGIPAIFRSVSLLATLAGSLTLEAYRNGRKLDQLDAPGIVKRADPFRIQRDFVRDTVWNLASRGEYLWYIGARDPDGLAVSLVNVPPGEVSVTWANELLGLRSYQWRGVDVPASRWVHGTFICEPGSPRGAGPLQLCGAAVSVAVEADEWAASFYAGGGLPSVVIKTEDELDDAEAELMRDRWLERPPRVPRVVSGPVTVEQVQISAADAQLTDARLANVGEVARMFGIPGKLLEYAQPGSSLTYQNLAEVGDDLIRFTLAPGYLEPVEQQLSDLLTRSTTARFNVNGLLRSSLPTRYNAYRVALGEGVPFLSVPEVREAEGLDPGGVEYAPVPPAPPAARPVLPEDLERIAGNGSGRMI